MALFVDDLDRTIIIRDVPGIYNAVYSTSLEELWAFCQSAHIFREAMVLKPAVSHNVAYIEKRKRHVVFKFGGSPIRFGETPWCDEWFTTSQS